MLLEIIEDMAIGVLVVNSIRLFLEVRRDYKFVKSNTVRDKDFESVFFKIEPVEWFVNFTWEV